VQESTRRLTQNIQNSQKKDPNRDTLRRSLQTRLFDIAGEAQR
jgi:hypothetical protein